MLLTRLLLTRAARVADRACRVLTCAAHGGSAHMCCTLALADLSVFRDSALDEFLIGPPFLSLMSVAAAGLASSAVGATAKLPHDSMTLAPWVSHKRRVASRVRIKSRSAASPRKPAHSASSGLTSTLMKPIWQLTIVAERGILERSMNGETAIPSSASRSPWPKNSIMERFAQVVAMISRFAGLAMSAACSAIVKSNRMSFRSTCDWWKPSPACFDLNLVRYSKWARMSVPRTIWITVSRMSL
mmetsp:Transcript_73261/g.145739  ORF Transcript_73261/g.145739 Transcript_73261/m.145739 type:complete len:244 (-) Transcript_73261:1519-2250(-)